MKNSKIVFINFIRKGDLFHKYTLKISLLKTSCQGRGHPHLCFSCRKASKKLKYTKN